jgi:hypothetical protein
MGGIGVIALGLFLHPAAEHAQLIDGVEAL